MLTPTKSKSLAFEIDIKEITEPTMTQSPSAMKVKERLEQRKMQVLSNSGEKGSSVEEKIEKAKAKRMTSLMAKTTAMQEKYSQKMTTVAQQKQFREIKN